MQRHLDQRAAHHVQRRLHLPHAARELLGHDVAPLPRAGLVRHHGVPVLVRPAEPLAQLARVDLRVEARVEPVVLGPVVHVLVGHGAVDLAEGGRVGARPALPEGLEGGAQRVDDELVLAAVPVVVVGRAGADGLEVGIVGRVGVVLYWDAA